MPKLFFTGETPSDCRAWYYCDACRNEQEEPIDVACPTWWFMWQHGSDIFWFCSNECWEVFVKDPVCEHCNNENEPEPSIN